MSDASGLRITEVAPDGLAAVAALCDRCFARSPAGLFARMMEFDPHADEAITLAGWDGDAMVATVRIFARRIRWQGRAMRLAGIGNVATNPDHRGRGHAAKLMNHAVALMPERGFEISLLFTDLHRVYEKSGYFKFNQPLFTADPTRLHAVDASGLTARAVQMPRDLAAVMALQLDFNEEHDGTTIRDESHWHSLAAMYPGDDTIALVAERGGEIAAHVRVMRDADATKTLRIHEISAVDATAAAAVLAEAAKRCAAIQTTRMAVTLPSWPVIHEAMTMVFADCSPSPRASGMWCALDGGPSKEEIRARCERGELHTWDGDRF